MSTGIGPLIAACLGLPEKPTLSETFGTPYAPLGISNVTSFGAVGDGITDNTNAIQSAIIAASPNGIVAFQSGKFACLNPLTIPANACIRFIGQGRFNSVLLYSGSAQVPFLVLPGGNIGCQFDSIGIAGANAKPAVQVTATSSQATFNDCAIGGVGIPAIGGTTSASPPSYVSIQGALLQGDDVRAFGTFFYGQQYGCRLEGAGNAQAFGSYFYGFPSGGGGISPGYGLWCANDGSNNFGGNLQLIGCRATEGFTAAILLRGLCTVISPFVDTSILPMQANTANVKLIGGRLRCVNAAAIALFSATNSQGEIIATNFVTNTAPVGLVNAITISGSTNPPRSWDITGAKMFNGVAVTPTGGLIACDQPHKVLVGAWNEGFLAAIAGKGSGPIPATATVVTNPYGVSCMVFLDTVTNGSGITITGAKINGQQVGITPPWYVSPMDTLEIDYTGTTPLPNLAYFGIK